MHEETTPHGIAVTHDGIAASAVGPAGTLEDVPAQP